MYDAMVSIAYNHGVGNLRMSDFIQLVKRGEFDKAKEEIKKISSNLFDQYPGLKIRREKESRMFMS
jgi:GH24 family phage-related lysozyme (muramidase)